MANGAGNRPRGPSTFEAMARKARADHSTATVEILYSLRREPTCKFVAGSGFIVKLANGGCKIMTCDHVIRHCKGAKWRIWVRLPNTPNPPTAIEFLEHKERIGTEVVLLGYFNPLVLRGVLGEKVLIAKEPSAIPGEIVGPRLDLENTRRNWSLPHSCYGIDGCSGSPMIHMKSLSKSADKGKAIGIYDSSLELIQSCIAAKTIKAQLRFWLGMKQERPSLQAMINML
ncbi:hypothetical protein EJB05_43615 [Eragrostis curvula]|uniref:Serine protease n=1 Tax=Eragrostis curvula TaxID=38414 RepID=A0A5J9TFX2_9POAL|nr:hypothetical protein EJB05_43615 [Eragrostis curvula]